MPTIALDFPGDDAPSAVTMLSITGSDGTSIPISSGAWTGPTIVGDVVRFAFPYFEGLSATYTYSAQGSFDGVVGEPFGGTWPGDGASSTPSSLYATLADLQTEWGDDSIADWSDPAGNKVQDDSRIQLHFVNADSEVATAFQVQPLQGPGGYVQPLQPLGSDVATARRWVVGLTGVSLYFLRSRGKDDPVGMGMVDLAARIRREMAYQALTGKFTAVRTQVGTEVPKAFGGRPAGLGGMDYRWGW